MSHYEDKTDLLLEKSLMSMAIMDGKDINNMNIKRISENEIETIPVEEALREINKIVEIKNNMFSDVDISSLSDIEFGKIIDEYHNRINIEVSQSIQEKTRNKYKNIDFDNLEEQTLKLLSHGDFLYDVNKKEYGDNGDYGPVILQWCRAVELELRNKIFRFLNRNDIKKDISNKSTTTEYYINKRKYDNRFKSIEVTYNIGFYGKLSSYGLEEYVFDNYIKNKYTNFTIQEFKELINNIIEVGKYRNSSAHSSVEIELNCASADDCKVYIVASKKILEVLSHLERR